MILSEESHKFLLGALDKFDGNYLEIGVYEGDMLREFALKWPERTFYGIDPFISCKDTTDHTSVPIGSRMESQRSSALANFNGIGNIIFFEVESRVFMDTMDKDTLDAMRVDVVYVDGNHSYDDTYNDLFLAKRLITGDGMIYIDDFDLSEVLRATKQFVDLNQERVFSHFEHMILLKP